MSSLLVLLVLDDEWRFELIVQDFQEARQVPSGVLRDQICTTQALKVDCIRQDDF